jgi:hypothetical protein
VKCPQWVESGHSLVFSGKRLLQAAPMERPSIVVRSVWAACLLIAGLNHARLLVQHGLFWDYGGLNPISAFYQTSLTLLDPLTAALLFLRPQTGIVATIILIITNVIHNVATIAQFAPTGEFLARVSHPITLSQVGFMLFVLASARIAWRGAARGATVQESSCPRSVGSGRLAADVENGASAFCGLRPSLRVGSPVGVSEDSAAASRRSYGRFTQSRLD